MLLFIFSLYSCSFTFSRRIILYKRYNFNHRSLRILYSARLSCFCSINYLTSIGALPELDLAAGCLPTWDLNAICCTRCDVGMSTSITFVIFLSRQSPSNPGMDPTRFQPPELGTRAQYVTQLARSGRYSYRSVGITSREATNFEETGDDRLLCTVTWAHLTKPLG